MGTELADEKNGANDGFPRRERMVCTALSMGSHRGNPLKVPGKLSPLSYVSFVIIV